MFESVTLEYGNTVKHFAYGFLFLHVCQQNIKQPAQKMHILSLALRSLPTLKQQNFNDSRLKSLSLRSRILRRAEYLYTNVSKERHYKCIGSLPKEQSLEIYAYCIMNSHIHVLCKATNGFILSDVIRNFNKFTSKQRRDYC